LGSDLVSDEPDRSGGCEHPKVGERLRVDKPLDRLVERDARRNENGEHDRETAKSLATRRSKEEDDAEWDGGQRVAEIADQVREQRDRSSQRENRGLKAGGSAEHSEADRDGAHPVARPDDRGVDKTVGVSVAVVVAEVGMPIVVSVESL
jgi:hypothetical protein